MEKRKSLYVLRRHPATWMTSVCMVAAVVAWIICPASGNVWAGQVLPCVAAVVYGLIVVCSGDAMLFRTAIPVWLYGISCGLRLGSVPGWMVSICLCVLYTRFITGFGPKLGLLIQALFALAALVYARLGVADVLMALGLIVLYPAIRVYTDNQWHPTWGDRIEGRRVRSAPAMEQITAYFMPDRTGANNLFNESVELTELEQYVREKRRQGLTGFGTSHVIMAAYARTVARYPALNRFIAGERIYSRGSDIALCMTVKKKMTTDAPDSLIKVHLHPADTAVQVYEKFTAELEKAKDEMENTNADNTADAFMMIPGLFLKFAIWLLKTMDYFGLIPRFLLEVSPFHGSVYFTSMGSLGIRPVYHHLYDFGTVPVFCAFGRKRRAEELHNGQVVERKYIDLKFNLDERICDGFYYSSVIKYFLRLLTHPQVLDTPPETVQQDIP